MELNEPSAKYLTRPDNQEVSRKRPTEDWTHRPVSDIAARTANAIVGGPFGSDLVSKDYVAFGVPVIRGQNMSKALVSGEFVFVSQEKARYLAANLAQPDDVIFTQRGTLGQVSLVPQKPFKKYLVSQSQMKLTVNSAVTSPRYIYHYFTSTEKQRQILESAIQTGVPHTNLGILRAYKIPVPPTLAEQHGIAEALTDADTLIESLEQLLAKKRQIKQGAMQELLTGQRRLPGFLDEWTTSTLGSLGFVYGGLTGKSKKDFGHGSARYIPFMNVMSSVVIDPAWLELVDVQPNEAQNDVKQGDLLFNGSSETPEEVGMCAVLHHNIPNLFLNSFCFGFRLHAGAQADGSFLVYWFRSAIGRATMSVLAQGATRYNIAKSAFVRLSLNLPPREEQTAIATILSDMDTEITALEARLTKARHLKQGMAQALLTGRIRLV